MYKPIIKESPRMRIPVNILGHIEENGVVSCSGLFIARYDDIKEHLTPR